MKRFLVILAAVLLIPAFASGAQAAGDNGSAKLDWHVSDAFIQSLGEPQWGAVARASEGDGIRVSGGGTLNTAARKATGSGTFVHEVGSGQLVAFGTWTATGLDSFTPYGCGVRAGQPIPENRCGGLAVIRLHGSISVLGYGHVELDSILSVNSLVGSHPAGLEGVKLDAGPLGPNFNITEPSVNGATVFVSRSNADG